MCAFRFLLVTCWIAVALLPACQPERPAGWTEATHGKDAAPAYDILFDDTVVHRIDITIAPEDYQAAMDDLEHNLGGGGPGPAVPGEPVNPIYVPVDLELGGVRWTHVGMRYKGNSSLSSALREGIYKFAFRLDFDRFEDDYPSIRNQRFYGFGKMTFSNAFKDASLIRDKLAADIFRRGGVPAARGAFARVYVDFGEGPTYFGLYTMIEDPSDRMLEAQFTDGSGNLYKPEGSRGANWQEFVEADFAKKTNEDSGFEDVIAALDALHADRSDAASWRAGLEAVFDVQGFLRWLAINQTIEDWDSYVCMGHNYYVYGDPGNGGRLTWIPWDLNEALLHEGGHCTPPTAPSSVLLDEVGDDKPLVRYLLDDPVYHQAYLDELAAGLEGAFELSWVQGRMDEYHALVAPWVVGEDGEVLPYSFLRDAAEFENSLEGASLTPLKPHAVARTNEVRAALGL